MPNNKTLENLEMHRFFALDQLLGIKHALKYTQRLITSMLGLQEVLPIKLNGMGKWFRYNTAPPQTFWGWMGELGLDNRDSFHQLKEAEYK